MVVMYCVLFAKETPKDLKFPKDVIQGFIFEDLISKTKWASKQANSGLKIYPIHGTNYLFIGQGRVKVSPREGLLKEISEKLGKKVNSFQVSVVAKHYFGGAAQPIVEAFDCKDINVDSDVGAKQQGVLEKLSLINPEICYIEIEGTEVAIEKICFFFI